MPPKKQPEKDKDKDKQPRNVLHAPPTPRSRRSGHTSTSSLGATPTPTTPGSRPPAAAAALTILNAPPATHFTRFQAINLGNQTLGGMPMGGLPMGGVPMVRSGATVPVRASSGTGPSLGVPPAAAKRMADIKGRTAPQGGFGPVNDFYRKRVVVVCA